MVGIGIGNPQGILGLFQEENLAENIVPVEVKVGKIVNPASPHYLTHIKYAEKLNSLISKNLVRFGSADNRHNL